MSRERVREALAAMAQLAGRDILGPAARMMLADLAEYPEARVLEALAACRREVRGFPSLADIIARIDDGRPGPEEAWAMIPKDEASSIVWTDEMREAFGSAKPLLGDDDVAARMAFREVYVKLLAAARAGRKPIRWEVSLGTDIHRRASVLLDAAARGRISHEQAQELLPAPPAPAGPLLEGPVDPELVPLASGELAKRIRALVGKGGSR